MRLKTKISLFIMALFVSAIGNALFTIILENYSDSKLKWVNHTNEVLMQAQTYLASMNDMETGQRGFLLTRDANYLEPYHSGLEKAVSSLTILKELTLDNQEQQERLKNLEDYMNEKMAELKETIDLAQGDEASFKKAIEIVKANKGKIVMDTFRHELNNFKHAEIILLEARKGDYREQKAKINTLITVEIVFFIVLAFLTVLFFNKNLFEPLKILLAGTKQTERGERIVVQDILAKDEMGYLISQIFSMNHIVNDKVENLDYKSNHDELTGLLNRTQLFSFLQEAISKAKESNTKVAVLFLDLNKFKPINDTMGHDVGDEILIETARRLNAIVRKGDMVFRIGGDEFLMIVQNVHTAEELIKNLARVEGAFDESMFVKGNPIEISISIGATLSPDDSTNPDELVKMADVAMYEAKHDKECNFKLFNQQMFKRASD